ncbi:MAG: hypothetical protein Faunusvirus31_6 [Faunusvirus sp.]|jgi:hypothetical protein|uniref:Uncharacterized protein n=1 Tax=Faunusvirus sp. TaxID=2487766 RepID=A0A3G4ZXK5_9VIRU|nr:MAG: hypothetical protein Faunusvirus31_6 [Faunusvirus sp.]
MTSALDLVETTEPAFTEMMKPVQMIANPFFAKQPELIKMYNYDTKTTTETKQRLDATHVKYIYKSFPRLLIVCLKNTASFDQSVYDLQIDAEKFRTVLGNYMIVEGSMKMLSNLTHKKNLVGMNAAVLELINHDKLTLNDRELVLPCVEISENDIKMYTKQFTGHTSLADIYKVKVLNDYFGNSSTNEMIRYNMMNQIKSMTESAYWSMQYNCRLNISKQMMARGFNLSLSQRLEDLEVAKVLKKLNESPQDGGNYLNFLYKKTDFVDGASMVQRNGYKLYRVVDIKPDAITNEHINSLFDTIRGEKETYNLLISLLTSREHCHLVLANAYVLRKYSDMFKKFIAPFKYAVAYGWVPFYLEESIKRTRITNKDRFVISIDTAACLPVFPFDYTDPTSSPYSTLLVSQEIIDAKHNVLGLGFSPTYKDYGIGTLNEFKHKMNIFTNGNSKESIFEGMDWTGRAISGSIMSACVPRRHPLTELFRKKYKTEDEMTFRYFNEYYANSDIDLMISATKQTTGNSPDDLYAYIDEAHKIFTLIQKNVVKQANVAPDVVKLVPYKTGAIFVNQEFIKRNIVQKNTKYTFEYIILHINDDDVKDLFYTRYVAEKFASNKTFIGTDKWNNPQYQTCFKMLDIADIMVVFIKTPQDKKMEADKEVVMKSTTDDAKKDEKNEKKEEKEGDAERTDEIKEEDDVQYQDTEDKEEKDEDAVVDADFKADDTNCVFAYKENIKFKIESKAMLHNIEMFPTKYKDFWSMVSKFHLPDVRALYDGVTVYMLPSAITAFMTFMNIDYKYFAGSKDPIEIINKNRGRGWGTYLNSAEKIRFAQYSTMIKKWQKLYGVKTSNVSSVNALFGVANIQDNLFKPRRINTDQYENVVPVEDNYDSGVVMNYIDSAAKLEEAYKTMFDYTEGTFKLLHMKAINRLGYINPLCKWIFDAAYSSINVTHRNRAKAAGAVVTMSDLADYELD